MVTESWRQSVPRRDVPRDENLIPNETLFVKVNEIQILPSLVFKKYMEEYYLYD
jgi:hypothetical protein